MDLRGNKIGVSIVNCNHLILVMEYSFIRLAIKKNKKKNDQEPFFIKHNNRYRVSPLMYMYKSYIPIVNRCTLLTTFNKTVYCVNYFSSFSLNMFNTNTCSQRRNLDLFKGVVHKKTFF